MSREGIILGSLKGQRSDTWPCLKYKQTNKQTSCTVFKGGKCESACSTVVQAYTQFLYLRFLQPIHIFTFFISNFLPLRSAISCSRFFGYLLFSWLKNQCKIIRLYHIRDQSFFIVYLYLLLPLLKVKDFFFLCINL